MKLAMCNKNSWFSDSISWAPQGPGSRRLVSSLHITDWLLRASETWKVTENFTVRFKLNGCWYIHILSMSPTQIV